MRQIVVAVPRGEGKTVLEMAQAHEGVNLARFEAVDIDDPIDLVLVHVSNKRVEGLVGQLEKNPKHAPYPAAIGSHGPFIPLLTRHRSKSWKSRNAAPLKYF
jgi:hypothetical protein